MRQITWDWDGLDDGCYSVPERDAAVLIPHLKRLVAEREAAQQRAYEIGRQLATRWASRIHHMYSESDIPLLKEQDAQNALAITLHNEYLFLRDLNAVVVLPDGSIAALTAQLIAEF